MKWCSGYLLGSDLRSSDRMSSGVEYFDSSLGFVSSHQKNIRCTRHTYSNSLPYFPEHPMNTTTLYTYRQREEERISELKFWLQVWIGRHVWSTMSRRRRWTRLWSRHPHSPPRIEIWALARGHYGHTLTNTQHTRTHSLPFPSYFGRVSICIIDACVMRLIQPLPKDRRGQSRIRKQQTEHLQISNLNSKIRSSEIRIFTIGDPKGT